MHKNILNKYLRHFGAEVHGIGYMQKLRKGGAPKDAVARQREMLGNKVQTIVDAGANIGHTAENYLKTFPHAQVHAFEPFADSFGQMQQRIGSNPRAKLLAMGLAASSGTAKLHVNKSAATDSLLTTASLGVSSDDACATIGEVDITLTTLDSYAAENNLKNIDILKMDVQGYEIEVLKGATQLLDAGSISMIFTECYF
jgi:FkbM family methyltransferase